MYMCINSTIRHPRFHTNYWAERHTARRLQQSPKSLSKTSLTIQGHLNKTQRSGLQTIAVCNMSLKSTQPFIPSG